MRFRRWVVFTFAVHVGVIVLDKGAGFILWKILEDQPRLKGAADLLTTLPFVMMAIANLGLAASSVFFLRKNRFEVKQVAETGAFVALVWGGLIAGLAILASQYLLPLIAPDWNFSLKYVVPICLCVPFLLTTSYFNSIQLAVEKIRDYNLVHLIASLLFLPLFLLLLFGFGKHVTVSIAEARLIGAVLITALTLWMLRGVARWRPRLHWPFLRVGLSYGWRANVTSVLTYLNHRADLFLVGFLYDAAGNDPLAEVAFYSWAVSFAELVWHFPEGMRDLFFSKVAGSSQRRAREITPALCRLCLWFGAVGSVIIYVSVNPVMQLVSPSEWALRWREPVMAALLVLFPGTVAFIVAKVLQADLAARGHLTQCIRACSIVSVIMIGLDWWLIPVHGALGAAYASSAAYLASAAYSLFAYRRAGGGGYLDCLVIRPSDASYVSDLLSAVIEKIRGGKS